MTNSLQQLDGQNKSQLRGLQMRHQRLSRSQDAWRNFFLVHLYDFWRKVRLRLLALLQAPQVRNSERYGEHPSSSYKSVRNCTDILLRRQHSRSMCTVEPFGPFEKDPVGDVTEVKLIDPKDYKEYFNWGAVGERLLERALEVLHA